MNHNVHYMHMERCSTLGTSLSLKDNSGRRKKIHPLLKKKKIKIGEASCIFHHRKHIRDKY